jgi:hypothetical protein
MRTLAVLAMVAALAACAHPGARVPAGAAEIHPSWTSCADEVPEPGLAYSAEPLELPRLGDGFEPVGPARTCALPAGRFALLRRADNLAGEIYVELDACQRVMVVQPEGPAGFAQGDDALVALLGRD